MKYHTHTQTQRAYTLKLNAHSSIDLLLSKRIHREDCFSSVKLKETLEMESSLCSSLPLYDNAQLLCNCECQPRSQSFQNGSNGVSLHLLPCLQAYTQAGVVKGVEEQQQQHASNSTALSAGARPSLATP